MVLLGFRAVRSATLASCVIGTMEGTHELDPDEFWRFSIIVGAFAEILAREQNSYPPDEAFAGGLLHTVGVRALDQYRPEMLRETLHDVQLALLGFTDAQLGGALTLHWNFPESLVAAVEGYSLDDPDLPGIPDLTAHVVSARAFTLSLGISGGLGSTGPSPPPAAWMRPGVTAELARAGGVEGVIERANAFVEATVT